MEDEDFLEAIEADNKGAPEEPVKVEVVKEPAKEPEPKPEPVAEQPQAAEPEVLELTEPAPGATKPEPGFVPLAAMLDARDRAKAAEERLRQIEGQMQQAQQPVYQRPDPYEDPEGFAAWNEMQTAQAVYQTRLEFSGQIASIKHGDDTVKVAREWGFQRCDADPYFNAQVRSSPDPIGYVVAEYKREEIASKVTPDEFVQFQAWKAAQNQLTTQQGGQPPPSTQTSAIPTPSLASAPSAGTILTEPVQSDEEMFNEVMPLKR